MVGTAHPTTSKMVRDTHPTNSAEDAEEMWEKVATGKLEIFPGSPVLELSHGTLGTAPGAPDAQPLIPELLRQTNPIRGGGETGQVLSEKGVTHDSGRNRVEETKPMRAAMEASEPVAAPLAGAKGPAAVTAGR